ncbi:hypothetical protein HPB51_004642 [Rhipicephalus microplus]|uniref:Endonuclease/exonuclease/phosphatase domain-containing protein n=1 Tax=Rhipicephalus microplus TaxID=6941 RepID=A0A9J6DFT6_RHIMP|nr:hypothetical protein HPB51_004642 [Rhipicephalus microplus]
MMSVLVRRRRAFVEHELDEASEIDNARREIIPSKGITAGLFVLNIYSTSSKKDLTPNFVCLFHEAIAKAASKPLLICGDFNAPHKHWGYSNASLTRRRLAGLVDDLNLTLLNEPILHTRIGQGVCRDTTLDLSLCISMDVTSCALPISDVSIALADWAHPSSSPDADDLRQ